MSRKRVPLNQNECTADFRIGVPFEQNLQLMGMKTYIRLLEAMDIPIKEHFIHMGTAKKDMMLKEKIWYLVQDCDERETSLLIYSIEGIKKGLKEYQQDSRK